jgi:hypothetical protein
MSAPQLTAYVNGPIAVSGDQLNTFMQTCDTAAQMRGLIGVGGLSLSARGIASVNDGLGGNFYWNSTSAGPDDNLNTIVPYGAKQGAWVRLSFTGVFYSVANVAALRAATVASVGAPLCYVQGYVTGADGGEGMFWYNSGDTTSADNGGTIIVDASNRRWYREAAAKQPWSISWFGASTALSDNTAIVQGMISILGAVNGGVIASGPGTFNFTGSLSIQVNGISIQGAGRGATTWLFSNGAEDCIVIGATFTTVISSTQISGINLQGSAKTGGRGVALLSATQSIIQDMLFSDMANGLYFQFINNVVVQRCIVLVQNASGYSYAAKWFSVASAAQTSNALTFKDVTINCFGVGAQGIIVDGACDTLRLQGVGIIHSVNGLLVQNTQQSNQYFPQFIFADDLEIDGVAVNCVNIQAGRQMKFVNCDFFNNFSGETSDTDVVAIASDGSFSVTNAIWFTNCRMAGAQQNGVYCTGKSVFFTGCYIGDNSVAGSASYNGISLGNDGGTNGAATSITITGGAIGAVFGDIQNQAYGVVAAAGVSRVTITGVDFANCVTGAIQDNTGAAGNIMWHGCIDINGVQLADRLPVLPADTSLADNGVIYYDATTGTLRTYLNGALKTISAS